MGRAKTFEQALGERGRARREALGLRQEDIAVEARLIGLPWTRPVVASIERGTRQLTVPELVVLLTVLDTSLHDLFRGEDAMLWLAPGYEIKASNVAAGLYGRRRLRDVSDRMIDLLSVVRADPATQAVAIGRIKWVMARISKELGLAKQQMQRVWPDGPEPAVILALWNARGEAERKAARALAVEPFIISAMALKLWGHPLATERDARAHESAPKNASPRTLQALRGHVTRSLLKEVAGALEDAEQRGGRRERRRVGAGGGQS